MILKKNAIISFALVICICVLSVFAGKSYKFKSASSDKNSSPKIILDAGHGGLTNTID